MTLVKTIQKDELTITLSDEGRVLLCAKTVLHWQQLFYSNAADRRIQQEASKVSPPLPMVSRIFPSLSPSARQVAISFS